MRRSPGYQLPLQLQEERPDAERRSRAVIEFMNLREERGVFHALIEHDEWFLEVGSRILDRYDQRLREMAARLIRLD